MNDRRRIGRSGAELRGARVLLCTLVCIASLAPASAAESARVDFARDVQPILARSCGKCHGAEKQKGGVRLDRRASALAQADSGEKAIVPGKSDESELIRRLEETDPTLRMPAGAEPLSADEIRTLRRWIDEGAEWPEAAGGEAGPAAGPMVVTDDDRRHWSYQPLRDVPVPEVDNPWCITPIDRFIVAALDEKGLRPNPPADRRTFIRRLYFDLIGLPPSPEEVEAFVADASPGAVEALIDRLLESPHYGERWARHWLDVARYADSDGYELDTDRSDAYHYRDFVIRAFNDDLSYQTFVRWQIAGDEYEPDRARALAATGFIAAAPTENLDTVAMQDEKLRLRYTELDDMAGTTFTAFLGLSLGCARCHDHKFDAIPTRDYYRILCAFTTTARRHVPLASRAEIARHRAAEAAWKQKLESAQGALAEWLAEAKKPHTAALLAERIEALPITSEEKKLLREQPESDRARALAKKHEKALQVPDKAFRQLFTDEQRSRWDTLKGAVAAIEQARPPALPTALAIADTGAEPQPNFLFERGDFRRKADRVELGFLTVLTNGRPPEEYFAAARRDKPLEQSTGQRRALAEWITDTEHGAGALLARVMVNRVWQHHFGEGLVRTASDFGVRGELPTRPELLEWLAREFVGRDPPGGNGDASGGPNASWSLKAHHRLIVTSAVYRQAATFDTARADVDPDNRLLWRKRPTRLEAEVLRDAVLAVSGTLNREPFGPAFKPPIPAEAIVSRNTRSPYPADAQDVPATRRRSVYLFHKRTTQHPLMQAFDAPDASASCGRRNVTTVAPQALALLNDPFLRARAVDFARRLLAEGEATSEQCVVRGYLLALSRAPNEREKSASVAFLDRQLAARAQREPSLASDEVRLAALADFCQVLFSLNEFLYVD